MVIHGDFDGDFDWDFLWDLPSGKLIHQKIGEFPQFCKRLPEAIPYEALLQPYIHNLLAID